MPNYALGLTQGGLVYLQSIPGVHPIPDPYPVDFLPYSKLVGSTGEGHSVEVGPPTLSWHFKFLMGDQWNWFYNTMCLGLASSPVYVRTSTRAGANFPFAVYSAQMWRPIANGQVVSGLLYADVEIKFRQLVPV
jgi:hypothetical protein